MDRDARRPLIAVVDDNEDNCVLLCALLGERFELAVHADGTAALEQFERDHPALVLLDISLPGMDGLEVLRRMRATPGLERIPTIALTAHALAGDRERLLAAGFDDYVSKPILDEERFYAVIDRLLVGRGERDLH